MARQGKGILGAPSKSVGMLTAQKHSGKDTIRSKPKPSIKTQTPELTRTKSNFQIANEFYEKFLLTGFSPMIEKKQKHKTFKNQFIGAIIKALSIKESGVYNLNPIEPTYSYFRIKAVFNVTSPLLPIRFWWGYQPYPVKSKESDIIFILSYVETTDEIDVSPYHPNRNRGNVMKTNRTLGEANPGHRFFRIALFISTDLIEISNGLLCIAIRPL